MDCRDLEKYLHTFSLVKVCETLPNGLLRIATPFQHTNGSFIDLFLTQKPGDLFQNWILTDLGQTIEYLADTQLNSSTKKRKQTILDICRSFEISFEGDELKINLEKDFTQLPDAILRLSQACIRVSDLVMTQKYRAIGEFKEEFEEYIASHNFEYETQYKLTGEYGREVELDFLVKGKTRSSLILTLSTANSQAAHTISNEALSRWYDLRNIRDQVKFLTVFDTRNDVFREADISRLNSLSLVLGFPASQDEIFEALAA